MKRTSNNEKKPNMKVCTRVHAGVDTSPVPGLASSS